jgi:acetoin utilization deacetylase AcuC-like enzyme
MPTPLARLMPGIFFAFGHAAHDPGPEHPETPSRLDAAWRGVRGAGMADAALFPGRLASYDELRRIHTGAYLDALERGEAAGWLDKETVFGPSSFSVAREATGAGLAMVDALLAGLSPTGFALIRPPGHHAEPDQGMGYCLLNNVAVASAHALVSGVRRVMIVDWDVHHGNGTQAAFWRSPDVLFVDIHQDRLYPDGGAEDDVGEGVGVGTTLNVPLAAGCGDADYMAALDRLILPLGECFRPDLVLVSCGFDAHVRDPLGGMRVTARGFGAMVARVRAFSNRFAEGRLGLFLEGGYAVEAVEESTEACLVALAGAEIQDPVGEPSRATFELLGRLRAAHNLC